MFAGRTHVHGLLLVNAHADGVIFAVDPAGSPFNVKVSGTGSDEPPVGTTVNEYVTVLPGANACAEPLTEILLALG